MSAFDPKQTFQLRLVSIIAPMADAQRLKTLGQCSACVFDGTTREWPKK
jgi:hypothetical protein